MKSFSQMYFNLWVHIYYYNNRFLLSFGRNKKYKGTKLGKVILGLTSPYIITRWLVSALLEKICIPYIKRANRKDDKRIFTYELAIVSIAKNEGPYIKEWIEYHKLLGVTQFYFYDNESNDNTIGILQPYLESGLVTYSLIKGKARQLDAYNDAINRYKNKCRYMAFIDLDEYIMPTEPFKPISTVVKELIAKHSKGASGVGINWAIYGSSNFDIAPTGLITENFNHRGNNREVKNAHIKTICNPRMVSYYISPHYPLYKLGAYSIGDNEERLYVWFCDKREYKNIRINHYYTKSKQQYLKKISRGLGDRIGEYDLNQFNNYDLNGIEDNSMAIYSSILREKLQIKG